MFDFSQLKSIAAHEAERHARVTKIDPYRVSSEKEASDLFFALKRDLQNDPSGTSDRGNATALYLDSHRDDRQVRAALHIYDTVTEHRFADAQVVTERAVQILNHAEGMF